MIELKGPDAHEWAAHRCTRQLVTELVANKDRAFVELLSACVASTDPRVTAAVMRYQFAENILKTMQPKPGGEDDSD